MNNNHSDTPKKNRLASFVIWLGFGIVLVLLLGMLIPSNGPRTVAFNIAAHNDEMQIVAAIKAYHTEYGRYPVNPGASGVAVFSKDNNLLFDVLRNRTGMLDGNALNPRNVVILEVPAVRDEKNPMGGLQKSTGVWYDPWGSPYHIAINLDKDAAFDGKTSIPNFYSDVGRLGSDIIAWSYGPNGKLGGGPALKLGFSNEPGAAGKLFGSGDIVSWK